MVVISISRLLSWLFDKKKALVSNTDYVEYVLESSLLSTDMQVVGRWLSIFLVSVDIWLLIVDLLSLVFCWGGAKG